MGFITFDVGNADVGGLDVVGVRGAGQQWISNLYEYEVDVQVEEEGGLHDDAINQLLINPVRVTFGTSAPTDVHGVIRELQMLSAYVDAPTRYVLRIVPKLWYLTQTRRNRIFQDASHLDIVKEVLEEHGLLADTHFEDRCNASYPTLEYTVQYEETDFRFISRLLEHNGIHYHFRMDPDGEVIILGDDNRVFEPVPDFESLQYLPTSNPEDDQPYVTELVRKRRVGAGTFVLRDYNWRTPTTPLRFEHEADGDTGHGVIDLYGEHVRADDDGPETARLRAEAHAARGDVFWGQTAARGIFAGTKFELTGHPNPDLDQEYLVISIEESTGSRDGGGGGYAKKFRAIPMEAPFRPERVTPWPRIDGLLNGKVDGESRSTATPIDDQGRYKIVFPFDERGKGGGKASRWIRSAQPSAGSGYGFHFPLHIGTEVVIAHINGDPDRPVIVGAIPNAETVSPVVAANATHSRIKTGSGIVLEMDDDC